MKISMYFSLISNNNSHKASIYICKNSLVHVYSIIMCFFQRRLETKYKHCQNIIMKTSHFMDTMSINYDDIQLDTHNLLNTF